MTPNALDEDEEKKEKNSFLENKPSRGLFSKCSPTLKEILILRLEKYIDRIESYLSDVMVDDNSYDRGFLLFKGSRAINREINYKLAKKLRDELKASDGTPEAINRIFQNVDEARTSIIIGLVPENQETKYKNRGIKSADLIEVIEIAKTSLGS